ncbi:SH3 domain-containing protein [Candidatus Latescibacterota bacterium]
MKTYRIPLVLFLVLLVSVSAVVSAQDKEKPKPLHAPLVLPGVEPEMRTPEYWISTYDDADEIVMSPEEIEAFNKKIRTKQIVFQDRFGRRDPLLQNYADKLKIGLFMHPIEPLELPDTVPSDSLRVWLAENIEYLYSRDFYDSRNATYSEQMKQDIVDNMNIEAVPNVIRHRWGVIVKRADMRLYPTSAAGFSETLWELDYFQTTGVYITNPVAILYESTDGDFYYVQSPIARGWISADKIALTSKKKVRQIVEEDNFLMASEDKVPIYADPSFETFIQHYYFSAKLPLIKQTGSAHIVKLPYRKLDGSLGTTKGYIKPDADVHAGYYPFTKANVIRQIFKLIDAPYGWGDQFNKRDCSGTQRVVQRCFGITTGRWPNFVLLASDHREYIDPRLSQEEKIEQVSKIEGGITWTGSGGHLVFYLGKAKNGKLYFMHQGGWGYDEGDQHYFVNRLAINEAHHSFYTIDSPRVFTTFRK